MPTPEQEYTDIPKLVINRYYTSMEIILGISSPKTPKRNYFAELMADASENPDKYYKLETKVAGGSFTMTCLKPNPKQCKADISISDLEQDLVSRYDGSKHRKQLSTWVYKGL